MDNQLSEELRKEIEADVKAMCDKYSPNDSYWLMVGSGVATKYALKLQEAEKSKDKLLKFAEDCLDSMDDELGEKWSNSNTSLNREQYLMANTKFAALKQLIESVKTNQNDTTTL